MSYNPVFQTMFSYQNYPMSPVGNDDITFKPEWIGRAAAQFDFAFFLWDQGGEIEGVVEFSTELFSRTTMEQLASRYISLLESLTNAPENRIGEFPLITKAERQTIISTWNATNRLFQDSLCLHELITRQAQEIPESIAIKFEDISLSYRELDEQSNALAHILREAGVVAEMPVGIMTQRSAGMILSQLAILKAGGAYVPLDPNYPPERIAFMLEDASITVVITESAVANLPQTVKTRILLDTIDLASVLYNKAPLTPLSGPDNAAYIIYTSGSTGKPKGVVIQHRSVVNFACSMVQEPGINSQDAVLALTTISFDISILELLVPLTAGAKVIIVSREVATDGIMLAKKISEEGITVMQGTPSTWRLLLSGGWSGAAELKALCGGEAFPPDLFKELYPKVGSVWNMYGPTETTVWSTCCRLTDTDTTISIGKPIANTCIYILDKFLNPVPVGLTGELYIGGQGVARCYLNRTELTDQRFIPDPFVSEPHAKMYATGDLARWLHNGTIECLGRIDAQVKIRGFRIELGEIENCISSYPGVRQSAALCKEFSPGDIRLLLYYVLHTAGSITASDLRKHLRSFLPDYMIPQHFIELETMPLTPSGKIDRKALQPPIEIAGSNSSVKTLPATPGELYLATVWKEVLGIDKVHTADTFFDLGGHSLLSIQVISRIKAETGVDVQPRSLMLNTLAEIAVSYPLNDHKINNEAYRKKSIASKLFRFIRPGKKQ
jgi:amino acid adenylation domain-containing protein